MVVLSAFRTSRLLFSPWKALLVASSCHIRRYLTLPMATANAPVSQSNNMHSTTRKSTQQHQTKDIWLLRHGQAMHNPRAEAAREAGCSFDHFLELMRQDDSLDSELTELGMEEARLVWKQPQNAGGIGYWLNDSSRISTEKNDNENKGKDRHTNSEDSSLLLVSSPLSRALKTADLVVPPRGQLSDQEKELSSPDTPITGTNPMTVKRVCCENIREINGSLLNARRRSVTELIRRFPHWDFSQLASETDHLWTPEMESPEACAKRGFQTLQWIFHDRPEKQILLVGHGGIFRYMMDPAMNSGVIVRDGRRQRGHDTDTSTREEGREDESLRVVTERFHNCELRRYRMESSRVEMPGTDEWEERVLLTEIEISGGDASEEVANSNP